MKFILCVFVCLVGVVSVSAINCFYTCSNPACCTPTFAENATGMSLVQGEIYYGYTLTVTQIGDY